MKWISVKDKMPEIPRGKYGIEVLVAVYDATYAEIDGSGYHVETAHYGSVVNRHGKRNSHFRGFKGDLHFQQLGVGPTSTSWLPFFDEITHWMYMPEPPQKAPAPKNIKTPKSIKKSEGMSPRDQEMFEKSFQRPRDYFKLSERRQWEIDEMLGILDWDGSKMTASERTRYRKHYGLKSK